jgi:cation transport ATPase
MIQLGILLPLAIGGIVAAVWREYRDNQVQRIALDLPTLASDHYQNTTKNLPQKAPNVYDDVGELDHYQQVSWYALAFSVSGVWFYVPVVTLISIPLLAYNAYHFANIMRHSDAADRKKPLTVFETIGVSATLLTGQFLSASLLFVFSFGVRKLLLQAGNISNNIPLSHSTNPNIKQVWVLREGAELEITVAALQPDDTIVMHEGDMVVVKGKIIKGDGVVSQFSLRKQMKSVPKTIGDRVFPFTLLESGSLHIQQMT